MTLRTIALRSVPALPAAALALAAAAPAQAYIGPGVGLGVIGTVFGIVATLALAVFGFLWYPMKRLMAKRRGAKAGAAATPAAPAAVANENAAAPVDTAVAAVPEAHRTGTVDPGTPVRPAIEGADVRAPERAPERDGA